MSELAAETLRDLVSYDPETGVFRRRRSKGAAKAGRVAGFLHGKGYLAFCVNGRVYGCHRLAWLYVYGTFPDEEIDHINGIPDDNRVANLREASHRQNMGNRKGNRGSRSGLKGAYRVHGRNGLSDRWRSSILGRHLGNFDSAEEAHAAYVVAAEKEFGSFARFD